MTPLACHEIAGVQGFEYQKGKGKHAKWISKRTQKRILSLKKS